MFSYVLASISSLNVFTGCHMHATLSFWTGIGVLKDARISKDRPHEDFHANENEMPVYWRRNPNESH